jgi:hypothetical protein
MSTIKLRRSAVQGSVPTTSTLADGEIALNTYDGKLYFNKSPNGVSSVVALQTYSGGTGINVDTSTGLISTKQDISITASPTFNGLTLNGALIDSTSSTGSAGQVLTSDGAGHIAWTTVSGGGSGGTAFSVNYTTQTLTKSQQAQARINVGLDDATIYFLSYMFG